jgi:hypothetical protein
MSSLQTMKDAIANKHKEYEQTRIDMAASQSSEIKKLNQSLALYQASLKQEQSKVQQIESEKQIQNQKLAQVLSNVS